MVTLHRWVLSFRNIGLKFIRASHSSCVLDRENKSSRHLTVPEEGRMEYTAQFIVKGQGNKTYTVTNAAWDLVSAQEMAAKHWPKIA